MASTELKFQMQIAIEEIKDIKSFLIKPFEQMHWNSELLCTQRDIVS